MVGVLFCFLLGLLHAVHDLDGDLADASVCLGELLLALLPVLRHHLQTLLVFLVKLSHTTLLTSLYFLDEGC
jgi:hypothetical protein